MEQSANTPLVSVIMPAYNAGKYICRAVDSVFAQDILLELIVVDDCSSDDTGEHLRIYMDRADFHYFRNEKNMGAAWSRNYGVKMASSPYVAYLDADDWWAEGKLKEQLRVLRQTGTVMCSTGRELMNPDGTSTGKIISVKPLITYRDLLRHNSINCSSVMIRRDVALEFPMTYDKSHEDYIAWLRILGKYACCAGINRPYLKCRLSEGGKSRNKLKSAKMTYAVYRYMGYGRMKSCLFFASYAANGVMKYWL